MIQTENRAQLTHAEMLAFLKKTAPFSELDTDELNRLIKKAKVAFYPAGHIILERGKSIINHLALIFSGKVRLFTVNELGDVAIFSYRRTGQSIGALGILRESHANLDVAAETDTICILLTRDDFASLIQSHAKFSQYYLKVLTEGYVSVAFSQLQRRKTAASESGSMLLFSAQVGDIVRRQPGRINQNASIRESAIVMDREKRDNLLICNAEDQPVGIVTDRDLRRVVANGLDYDSTVQSIMSSPLQSIPSHMLCFDALLEMIRRKQHHLTMHKNGRITGVLSSHDLMLMQGASPLELVKKIGEADRFEQIYDLALGSPQVMHTLILEGANPINITRLITLVNDHILHRILSLLEAELGPAPLPYCWLLMGSEGRKEQTFKTDQDNGIVYADAEDDDQAEACRAYFTKLSHEATRHLVNCGFPRCPGDIMASNPAWCQPLSVWKRYFHNWVTTPVPQDILNATIFFDFRPSYGDHQVGGDLRAYLLEIVQGQDLFIRFLAKACVSTPSAFGIFKRFALEKHGPHKNMLDLKTRGITPFVDFARLMTLKHQVDETNTLKRLESLASGDIIRDDLSRKIRQAYEILMQVRLAHQDQQWENGTDPDNFISPNQLNEIERNSLKDALGTAEDIRTYLTEEFQLRSG